MQINEHCIRDILKYLVENLNINSKSNNSFSYEKLNTLHVVNTLQGDYDESDIIYSINILSQCGYIKGKNLQEKYKIYYINQEIEEVTYIGQKFYETIKPEQIWNKTKSVISKVGVHTLGFIENVAHDVAVESAKQATTIMMTKN